MLWKPVVRLKPQTELSSQLQSVRNKQRSGRGRKRQHMSNKLRGRTTTDLFGNRQFAQGGNSKGGGWGVHRRWGFNHRTERLLVMAAVNCSHFICASGDEPGRYKSNRHAKTSHSSPATAAVLSQQEHDPSITASEHLQTRFASLLLVTQHTKTRWDPKPT